METEPFQASFPSENDEAQIEEPVSTTEDDLYRGAEDIADDMTRNVINDAVTEATKSQMLEERKPHEKAKEKEEEESVISPVDNDDDDDDDESSSDYPPASEYPALRFLSPKVLYVLYWRSPKLTGTVFAVLLTFALALLCYTAIQVVCLALQSILAVSLGWRLVVALKQAVQKEPQTNPFQSYVNADIASFVSESQVVCFARQTRELLINEAKCLVRFLAVDNAVESIKFGIAVAIIKAVVGCCSTLTLFIVGILAFFTLPKLYEKNQAKVDEMAAKGKQQLCVLQNKIMARLPFFKKKVQ